MTSSDSRNWEQALNDACFPVSLTDVYVGTPSRRAKRYRAVMPVDPRHGDEPFAIVTDHYRLIRNEDVVDLGQEAFARLFGPHHQTRMTVFNVMLATGRGSFIADFTAPSLDCTIPIPVPAPEPGVDPRRHTFFLRVVNSYNRTQAVRLEAGICRWICRNGMIFGKQSIQFRDPHHKTKHQLMDQIARDARRLPTNELSEQIGSIYGVRLTPEMSVLEGAWQTLRLAIPQVDPKARTARVWQERCASLSALAETYETRHGRTTFSVLQAASQWAREQERTSPIQRHSYERRCGEMLEQITANARWPDRDRQAQDQVDRIRGWSKVSLEARQNGLIF